MLVMLQAIINLFRSDADIELEKLKAEMPQEVLERIRIQNYLIAQGFTLQEAQEAYDEMTGNDNQWGDLYLW